MAQFLFGVIGVILAAIVHVFLIIGFALTACVTLLLALLVLLVIRAKQQE